MNQFLICSLPRQLFVCAGNFFFTLSEYHSIYITLPKIYFKITSSLKFPAKNGYETRQSSLLYVIVLFFGLDPAQNTIVVYSELKN